MDKSSTNQLYTYFGNDALAGGLNVTDNPIILGPSQMAVAQNIEASQSLARKKRRGQASYNTTNAYGTSGWPAANKPIRGLIQYWRYPASLGEAHQDIFLHSNGKVWSIADRGSNAIDRTGSLTLSTTGVPSYQVFNGKLYFTSTNQADGYNKWDGTVSSPGAAVAATAPPDGPGKYLGTYRGRMVMGGNINYPYRLYISAPNDGDTWTGLSATSLDLDYDGDVEGITAIFSQLNGALFIATRKCIYELVCSDVADLTTYQVNAITKGIGCVGPTMWCATANDIYFWSDRGLHSLLKTVTSDQTTITFASSSIQKLYTDLIASNLLNQGSCVWDQQSNLIVTTLPSSGQTLNDTILAYNASTGFWCGSWSGIGARSLSTVFINNKPYVLCGREDGNITYLDPSLSQDMGVNFSSSFTTGKIYPGNDISSEKAFKALTLFCSSTNVSTIQVTWTIDTIDNSFSDTFSFTIGNTGALLGSTFVLGASKLGIGRFLPWRQTIDCVGYSIQFSVNVSGGSNFEFYGFALEVDNANSNFGF